MAKPRPLTMKARLESVEGPIQDWRGENGRHYFLTLAENGAPDPVIGMVGVITWGPNPRCYGKNVWSFNPIPPGGDSSFHFPHKVRACLKRVHPVTTIDATVTAALAHIKARHGTTPDPAQLRLQSWQVISGPMEGLTLIILDQYNGLPGATIGTEAFLHLIPDSVSQTGQNWHVRPLNKNKEVHE